LLLYLRDRFGVRAGSVQMAYDVALLFAATSLLPARNLAVSALGTIAVNGVIAAHHRSARYVGVTGYAHRRTVRVRAGDVFRSDREEP
jgi:uncharacterized membrane-anchored protein YitT (DUF2179 family)